jgi:hypothetical protein
MLIDSVTIKKHENTIGSVKDEQKTQKTLEKFVKHTNIGDVKASEIVKIIQIGIYENQDKTLTKYHHVITNIILKKSTNTSIIFGLIKKMIYVKHDIY